MFNHIQTLTNTITYYIDFFYKISVTRKSQGRENFSRSQFHRHPVRTLTTFRMRPIELHGGGITFHFFGWRGRTEGGAPRRRGLQECGFLGAVLGLRVTFPSCQGTRPCNVTRATTHVSYDSRKTGWPSSPGHALWKRWWFRNCVGSDWARDGVAPETNLSL